MLTHPDSTLIGIRISMRHPFIKIDAIADDLPDDIAALTGGVQALVSVLFGQQSDTRIPGVNLSAGLIETLHIYAGEQPLDPLKEASYQASLSRLRFLFEKTSYRLPLTSDTAQYNEAQAFYKKLLKVYSPIEQILGDLIKILGRAPYWYRPDQLPKTVPDLKEMTLKLLCLLRGHIGIILEFARKKEVPLRPHEVIMLSVIHSQDRGHVSETRLAIALNPFAPLKKSQIAALMHYLNERLRSVDIIIKNASNCGYYLEDGSAAMIDAYPTNRQPVYIPPPTQRPPRIGVP